MKPQAISTETFLGVVSLRDVPPALPCAEETQYPLDTARAVPGIDLKVVDTCSPSTKV